ncbi:MAG TPA: glycosyltransferase [Terriglobales bacterium]|jgi:glycosyltransferase involved in cell wall biosynthesis/2-polyprenyl-3-methyl-5-hydroxy-6-metoxy-1,4-benzoquinol methylase/Tfp pilus assembly protein PilF
MPTNEYHANALKAFHEGRMEEAARLLGEALGDEESGELWNDWATAQFQLSKSEEAEEGYRRALELDDKNGEAALNLGVLLKHSGRSGEAIEWFERAARYLAGPDRSSVIAMQEECRLATASILPSDAITSHLLKFAGKNNNEQSYLETHLARYVKTLELLPNAAPGQTLLELGAAFHHLTPSLTSLKGYDVRCSDIWEGDAKTVRQIISIDGTESHEVDVDNFDVEHFPWPYPDASFDVVLCCEMLEHLISDPMGVVAEMNRVLKPSGLLLLTTPNMASAKSVEYALKGESPYIYGRYEPGGRPTDHHNREYTTNEVERLLTFGGFQVERIVTQDSWWNRDRSLLRLFASRGLPIARRGDNTLCLARKTNSAIERYPEEFYLTVGTQSVRRDDQVGSAESEDSNSDRPLRVLIVNEMLPQTDRNGSDVRIMQIVRELREQGHQVTYIARNGHLREYYTSALEDLGVKVWAHDSERLHYLGVDDPIEWNLSQVLQEGNFDLAILLMWFWTSTSIPEHYMGAIRQQSPGTRIAVLTDDQHGLRELRMAQLTKLWSDHERAENYGTRELEVYRNADIVLSISEDDRRGLLSRDPSLNISLLPMIAELLPEEPALADRKGVLFLGNFTNAANRDGVEWLLKEVWPLVRARVPEATLSLVGSNLPAGLGSQEGVQPIGHVPDIKPFLLQHRVFVCPIRFGTGIKTKNLSALGSGLSLVTTTIGAEGMNLRHGHSALIADNAEEFAAAIVRAYTDNILWQRLSREGRQHMAIEFGYPRLQKSIRTLVQQVHMAEVSANNRLYEPSYLEVEKLNPEILTCRPAHYRKWLRLTGYLQLAEEHLTHSCPSQALEQLRHIFSTSRDGEHAQVIFDHALNLMARCYSELGNEDKAREYERIRRDTERERSALQPQAPALVAKGSGPRLSVIIPSYNRAAQLKVCLANLEAQSLPADNWEIIVVDDGSTDRTAEVCEEFPSYCRFEYLRQSHAGIGAALHVGVQRARSPYLLFIKDDTIPHSSMLADHLQAQYALGDKKGAILGSRAYPSEAAESALNLFIAQNPLFFVQSLLSPELQSKRFYFMASNLSISKDLVLSLGSFDATLEIGADVELGVRMHNAGYLLQKLATIKSEHNHLSTSVEEFINKARRYGRAQARLFRIHPSLVGDGTGPFGKLEDSSMKKIKQLLKQTRAETLQKTKELEKMNSVSLRPYLNTPAGAQKIKSVMQAVKESASAVYWSHFFASFLASWNEGKVRAAKAGT